MKRTALCVAIGLTLSMAARAEAQTVSPVVATTCHGTITSLELIEHASYDATFHNSGTVAVDDIHVAIPYGRTKLATFDVHDSFPPGADVTEHLHKNLSGGLFATATNDDRCSVTYVHFANGQFWGKPKL
jgi:hypothetical protein